MRHVSAGLLLAAIFAGSPALAQSVGTAQEDGVDQFGLSPSATPSPRVNELPPVGRVADSAAGRAGQRQTREQAQGIEPMARINNRVRNRVEARIRNRIDRFYDPRANATSPFVVAGEQARAAGRPRRR